MEAIWSKKESTDYLHHFFLCDMWHMTHGVWWTLWQNFRSLALTVWELWCSEDISTKDDPLNELINELMNYKGVCRTAPATPGLLKT